MIPPRLAARPSAALPLTWLVTAAAAFVLAAAGVVWLAPALAGHYYQPRVVALTHTVTLGWITLSIVGASYQLMPIVLERPVWSERLGWWAYAALAVGVAGMVAHFAIATWPGLLAAAAILALGVALHLVNVVVTVRGASRSGFTARLIMMGYAGLALTVAFGLLLGADRVWHLLPGAFFPTLHAHLHLALGGWVAPVVLGVGARVLPMFLLAPEPHAALTRVQTWGLGLGVPALTLGLLVAPALVPAAALGVGAAVAAHLAWVWQALRARRRPALDQGLRLVLAGAAFLAAGAALGGGLAFGLWQGSRLGLAYVVLLLGGWLSLTIAGMMLKIVPFLVWYRVYGPRAGREPVPPLGGLGSPRSEAWAAWLLPVGMAGLAAAVALAEPGAIRASGAVVLAGALAWMWSLGRALHHLAPCPLRRVPAAAGTARAR